MDVLLADIRESREVLALGELVRWRQMVRARPEQKRANRPKTIFCSSHRKLDRAAPYVTVQIRKLTRETLREANHGHGLCSVWRRNESSVFLPDGDGGGIRFRRDAFADRSPSLDGQTGTLPHFDRRFGSKMALLD
jgi:hypothetical protein